MSLTVVTGGGRGIGAATALRLAAAGHDLVLGYRRDRSAAEATAERVRGHGVDCVTVAADVTDPDRVDAFSTRPPASAGSPAASTTPAQRCTSVTSWTPLST